jgi:hypothetical protein
MVASSSTGRRLHQALVDAGSIKHDCNSSRSAKKLPYRVDADNPLPKIVDARRHDNDPRIWLESRAVVVQRHNDAEP